MLAFVEKQGKAVVPLDIMLTKEKRILIISGPNAGGKSVCLKTVGLVQYMLQCGLSVPVGERSRMGVFRNIFIDIGDEQSIENDLSTYSSHLMNMKQMMRHADDSTCCPRDLHYICNMKKERFSWKSGREVFATRLREYGRS